MSAETNIFTTAAAGGTSKRLSVIRSLSFFFVSSTWTSFLSVPNLWGGRQERASSYDAAFNKNDVARRGSSTTGADGAGPVEDDKPWTTRPPSTAPHIVDVPGGGPSRMDKIFVAGYQVGRTRTSRGTKNSRQAALSRADSKRTTRPRRSQKFPPNKNAAFGQEDVEHRNVDEKPNDSLTRSHYEEDASSNTSGPQRQEHPDQLRDDVDRRVVQRSSPSWNSGRETTSVLQRIVERSEIKRAAAETTVLSSHVEAATTSSHQRHMKNKAEMGREVVAAKKIAADQAAASAAAAVDKKAVEGSDGKNTNIVPPDVELQFQQSSFAPDSKADAMEKLKLFEEFQEYQEWLKQKQQKKISTVSDTTTAAGVHDKGTTRIQHVTEYKTPVKIQRISPAPAPAPEETPASSPATVEVPAPASAPKTTTPAAAPEVEQETPDPAAAHQRPSPAEQTVTPDAPSSSEPAPSPVQHPPATETSEPDVEMLQAPDGPQAAPVPATPTPTPSTKSLPGTEPEPPPPTHGALSFFDDSEKTDEAIPGQFGSGSLGGGSELSGVSEVSDAHTTPAPSSGLPNNVTGGGASSNQTFAVPSEVLSSGEVGKDEAKSGEAATKDACMTLALIFGGVGSLLCLVLVMVMICLVLHYKEGYEENASIKATLARSQILRLNDGTIAVTPTVTTTPAPDTTTESPPMNRDEVHLTSSQESPHPTSHLHSKGSADRIASGEQKDLQADDKSQQGLPSGQVRQAGDGANNLNPLNLQPGTEEPAPVRTGDGVLADVLAGDHPFPAGDDEGTPATGAATGPHEYGEAPAAAAGGRASMVVYSAAPPGVPQEDEQFGDEINSFAPSLESTQQDNKKILSSFGKEPAGSKEAKQLQSGDPSNRSRGVAQIPDITTSVTPAGVVPTSRAGQLGGPAQDEILSAAGAPLLGAHVREYNRGVAGPKSAGSHDSAGMSYDEHHEEAAASKAVAAQQPQSFLASHSLARGGRISKQMSKSLSGIVSFSEENPDDAGIADMAEAGRQKIKKSRNKESAAAKELSKSLSSKKSMKSSKSLSNKSMSKKNVSDASGHSDRDYDYSKKVKKSASGRDLREKDRNRSASAKKSKKQGGDAAAPSKDLSYGSGSTASFVDLIKSSHAPASHAAAPASEAPRQQGSLFLQRALEHHEAVGKVMGNMGSQTSQNRLSAAISSGRLSQSLGSQQPAIPGSLQPAQPGSQLAAPQSSFGALADTIRRASKLASKVSSKASSGGSRSGRSDASAKRSMKKEKMRSRNKSGDLRGEPRSGAPRSGTGGGRKSDRPPSVIGSVWQPGGE
ncbi:unnamed protein product [Amoebophrya sp. A120]|nr:unnamed protein product [Amoebophrya sp. A120]|eukprot:GSA120T00003903001.1